MAKKARKEIVDKTTSKKACNKAIIKIFEKC